MFSSEVYDFAQKLWDYHHVNHTLKKADIIFVMCSHDLRVADYVAQLYKDGYAPIILFSGGIAHKGDLVETPWNNPEAEMFAQRVIKLGVPEVNIIIENKATNCGENVLFSKKILQEKNIKYNTIIAVQKPYMERRTWATIQVYWKGKNLMVTSPNIDFENYPNEDISMENVINIMVGDLQRIKEYPKLGFQIEQDIPDDVWVAYENLLDLGFNNHLIK